MNENDSDLLTTYMWGFNDELDGRESVEQITPLLTRAYELGRSDALIGDDVRSVDYQSNEEILTRIREVKTNIIDDWLEKHGNPEIAKKVELEAAAIEYAHKSFVYPLNTFGEPMSIPPAQTVPMGYRKHCKVAKKHFIAGAKWQAEQFKEVINRLQEKYDENGYGANLINKLLRVEQHFDATVGILSNLSKGSYTEEEMHQLTNDYHLYLYQHNLKFLEFTFSEWFEQFKKK